MHQVSQISAAGVTLAASPRSAQPIPLMLPRAADDFGQLPPGLRTPFVDRVEHLHLAGCKIVRPAAKRRELRVGLRAHFRQALHAGRPALLTSLLRNLPPAVFAQRVVRKPKLIPSIAQRAAVDRSLGMGATPRRGDLRIAPAFRVVLAQEAIEVRSDDDFLRVGNAEAFCRGVDPIHRPSEPLGELLDRHAFVISPENRQFLSRPRLMFDYCRDRNLEHRRPRLHRRRRPSGKPLRDRRAALPPGMPPQRPIFGLRPGLPFHGVVASPFSAARYCTAAA